MRRPAVSPMVWDRHTIYAEIRRRGETLTSLAKKNGLRSNGLSVALSTPFPKAEHVIADFLGVSVEDLWPDRVLERRQRIARQLGIEASDVPGVPDTRHPHTRRAGRQRVAA